MVGVCPHAPAAHTAAVNNQVFDMLDYSSITLSEKVAWRY
jgi:hypothetical protein